MNLVKTYIDRSPIQGIGLFAAEFIQKGKLTWEYGICDKTWTKIEFEQIKSTLTQIELDYILRYSYDEEDSIIFCGDDSKYTNHSYDANIDREGRAVRDIQIGEEITNNYKELNGDDWNEEEFKILKSYKDEL